MGWEWGGGGCAQKRRGESNRVRARFIQVGKRGATFSHCRTEEGVSKETPGDLL